MSKCLKLHNKHFVSPRTDRLLNLFDFKCFCSHLWKFGPRSIKNMAKKKMDLNGRSCPNWSQQSAARPTMTLKLIRRKAKKMITNGFEVEGKRFTFNAEDHNKFINLVAIDGVKQMEKLASKQEK